MLEGSAGEKARNGGNEPRRTGEVLKAKVDGKKR
jgi:hypothetical protein